MKENAKISRRDFLGYAGMTAGAIGLGLSGFSCSGSRQSAGKRPNIIVIVADDLGYNDLGCQGGTEIPTPSIDSIAANGVRFTDGYVTCPVCSPSRAALLTGIYQQRFGFEFLISEAPNNDGIPANVKNLAEHLKPHGYKTCAIGKWHLGLAEQYIPNNRGFDEFFGFRGGNRNYFELEPKSGDFASYYQNIYRNNEVVVEKEYLTDALGRETIKFIEKQGNEPFFIYLAFNAVHLPLQAKKKYEAMFEGKITNRQRLTYAAMLVSMDEAVGKILATLRQKGMEDDTLIFFISDNGGKRGIADNSPLSGQKGTLLEGGVRVPFLAQWKGRIPAGSIYTKPVISIDIVPTAMAAAKAAPAPAVEGVDLLAFVTGEDAGSPHEALYWRNGDVWAVRQGNWKALGRTESGKTELYDLAANIFETDVAAQFPEKLEQLRQLYLLWDKNNIEAKWQRPEVQLVP